MRFNGGNGVTQNACYILVVRLSWNVYPKFAIII